MTKSEQIARYNAESAEKVMYFNGLPPDKQLLVAGDKAFWQHDCRRYLYGGVCVACSRRMVRRPSAAIRSPVASP